MNFKKLYLLTFLITILIGFSECTVNKRLYNNGYSVSWNKLPPKSIKNPESQKVEAKIKKTEPTVELDEAEADVPLSASLDNGNPEIINHHYKPKPIIIDSCGDVMTMRNGDEIKIKVLEINPKTVKYKTCDNLDGPIMVTNIENVFMIKYLNGKKEIFEKEIEKPKTEDDYIAPKVVQPRIYNAFAIASFVCACSFFLYITPILSIIFGIIALHQFKNNPEKYNGKWMAIAGIVASSVLIAIVLASLVFVIAVLFVG